MIKLSVELVPETCWNSNLRSLLPKREWDIIRKKAYKEANYECEVCSNIGGRLECHEVWEYDDENKIQKLVGLVALCTDCHLVKHVGFARSQGKEELAIRQLMKVNKWAREKAEEYVEEAFQAWEKRSKVEWKQDVSFIKK